MKHVVAGAMGLALLASSVQAQDGVRPADRADFQCLMVASFVVGGMDESQAELKAAWASALMYYLGRLDGRSPDVAWPSRLSDVAQRATMADIDPHYQRCAQEIEAKGRELIAASGAGQPAAS